MLLNFDAFIALPGGILSLQEVMSILFWADGNFHRKSLGFLNVNCFFDGFFILYKSCYRIGIHLSSDARYHNIYPNC